LTPGGHELGWLGRGDALLAAMLAAIGAARESVRLETYIFADDATGRRFRDALAAAARRDIRVQVMVDAFGSLGTPDAFFAPVRRAGAEVGRFNAGKLGRLALRDHRKLLLVDGDEAFVGGCNLADVYDGDGVVSGWRDGGLRLKGPMAGALEREFSAHWRRAQAGAWQRPLAGRVLETTDGDLTAYWLEPVLGPNPFRRALRNDLGRAKRIDLTAAYFLPSRRFLRQLRRAAGRGARVRLLLAGKSDVPLVSRASRSLYPALLRAGVAIFEYQPQVLHAKTLVLDDVVYVGSSNLDPRSFGLNFELMLRVRNGGLAAAEQFEEDLTRSRPVTDPAPTSSPWSRAYEWIARGVLTRLDPWVAREQLRRL